MLQSLIFLLMLPAYALCVWCYGKVIAYLDVLQPSWWMSFTLSDHQHMIKLFTCKWCLSFHTTWLLFLPLAHNLGAISYIFLVAILFYITASQTGLIK